MSAKNGIYTDNTTATPVYPTTMEVLFADLPATRHRDGAAEIRILPSNLTVRRRIAVSCRKINDSGAENYDAFSLITVATREQATRMDQSSIQIDFSNPAVASAVVVKLRILGEAKLLLLTTATRPSLKAAAKKPLAVDLYG